MATFLQNREPKIHQNLSLNNMVYVDTKSFDVTDLSEIQSLFEFDSAIDYILNVFPVLFLNFNTVITQKTKHQIRK